MATERSYHVQPVARACEILRALSDNRAPMTHAEIAQATGLPRSGIYAILQTLVREQMVQKAGDHYSPDMGLARLWARYKSRVEAERDRLDRRINELEVD